MTNIQSNLLMPFFNLSIKVKLANLSLHAFHAQLLIHFLYIDDVHVHTHICI